MLTILFPFKMLFTLDNIEENVASTLYWKNSTPGFNAFISKELCLIFHVAITSLCIDEFPFPKGHSTSIFSSSAGFSFTELWLGSRGESEVLGSSFASEFSFVTVSKLNDWVCESLPFAGSSFIFSNDESTLQTSRLMLSYNDVLPANFRGKHTLENTTSRTLLGYS